MNNNRFQFVPIFFSIFLTAKISAQEILKSKYYFINGYEVKSYQWKLGDTEVAAMTYPLIEGAGNFLMSANMSAVMTAKFAW